jgi:hypothetical protein
MIRTVILAALCAVLFIPAANAKPRHHSNLQENLAGCDVMRPCYGNGRPLFDSGLAQDSLYSHRAAKHRAERQGYRRVPEALQRVMAEGAGRVVSHPVGCPRRAFCGCGAAVRIFGKPIRSLWLAANWFRFPRASPAPGTVAVRRHHVFVLERKISGATWLVYDANSGRHRTRVHPRSIAGYVIVDPRADS